MADIYGPVTEHPELPIEDEGRFTVRIRRHEYIEPRVNSYGGRPVVTGCDTCGFPEFDDYGRIHPVHRI